MRILKFIFIVPLFAVCGIANATPANTPQSQQVVQCLIDIGNDTTEFVDPIKSNILRGREFNQALVDREKDALYDLVAKNIMKRCTENFNDFNFDIVDATKIDIPFKLDDKYYKLTVDVETLFEHISIPTAVLVMNFNNKNIGDKITKADTPSEMFFSADCSDHYVRDNISDDGPVNRAGQAAFPTYTGEEFFIDFPFGKSNRAFPGLIIAAHTGIGGAEEVVWYPNYRVARANAKTFVEGLKNTACSKDNLSAYVVSMPVNPEKSWDSSGWFFWGVGILTGGIGMGISLLPPTLADINEVTIFDGPYLIR